MATRNRATAADGSQPAGDGGQTLEQARENGRKGAAVARQMRERGELPPDNGAGTMKGDNGNRKRR